MKIRLSSFLPFLFFIVSTQNIFGQFDIGVPFIDATGYVEYIPGNLPVIVSVPHGGDLLPADIPDRDCNNFVCARDQFTQELARSVLAAFEEETGCYPHMVINLLHRSKFDANRQINEAADGNSTVELSWMNYHSFIDSAKSQVIEDHGRGLFLDLHGHGHEIQRIELGYRLSKSELQLSDAELDSLFYIEQSSIQTLVDDNLSMLSHAQLLRGDHSFGTLLGNKDFPTVPSTQDKFPDTNEAYFSGGYNTGRHGSEDGGLIDAIQIECNQDIRFDSGMREVFAHSLVQVIREYISRHYDPEFTESSCGIISGVNDIKSQYEVLLFPNPASDILNFQSKKLPTQLDIFNCIGQLMISGDWQGNPIDISELEKGYYIVQLVYANSSIIVKQFVKI